MCDASSPAKPDATVEFSLSIAPDFLAVRDSLRKLRDHFAPHLPAEAMDMGELVTAEILNNIVEHAFADRDTSEVVLDLSSVLEKDRWTIEVRDNGRPMPGGTVPGAAMPEFDPGRPSDLPEGGFGWALVQTLVDGVDYHHDGTFNQVKAWINH